MLFFSLIPENNLQISGQKSRLPKSCFQGIIIIDRIFKDFLVRKEGHGGAVFLRAAGPDFFYGIHGFSALIALSVYFSVPADFHLKPFGKSVDDRCAYAVQTAGYLVSAAAELAARMKDGKYNLHRRKSRFLLDIHRDSAAVIHDRDGIIRIHRNLYRITETGQRLVHCIIHNLIDQMMESSERRAADIHARPLSYRLQTFQNLYLICIIFRTHAADSSCLNSLYRC